MTKIEKQLEKIAVCVDMSEIESEKLCQVLPLAVAQGRVYLVREIADELNKRAFEKSRLFANS